MFIYIVRRKPKSGAVNSFFKRRTLPEKVTKRLVFGNSGLLLGSKYSMSHSGISVIKRSFKRVKSKHNSGKQKFWMPYKSVIPVTKKSNKSRMGKGKGKIRAYCYFVYRGFFLVEFRGVGARKAQAALQRLTHRLPCRSSVVIRHVNTWKSAVANYAHCFYLAKAGAAKKKKLMSAIT